MLIAETQVLSYKKYCYLRNKNIIDYTFYNVPTWRDSDNRLKQRQTFKVLKLNFFVLTLLLLRIVTGNNYIFKDIINK